jgi:hypothetical protein
MENEVVRSHLPAGDRYTIGMDTEQWNIHQLNETEPDEQDPGTCDKVTTNWIRYGISDCLVTFLPGFPCRHHPEFNRVSDKLSVINRNPLSNCSDSGTEIVNMAQSYQDFRGFIGQPQPPD